MLRFRTPLIVFGAVALIGVFAVCVCIPVREIYLGIPPKARPHQQILKATHRPTAIDIVNRLAWAGPFAILLILNGLNATRRSNGMPLDRRLFPQLRKKDFCIALFLIIAGLIGLRLFLLNQYIAVTMPGGILLLVASCFAIGAGVLLPFRSSLIGGTIGVAVATAIIFYSYAHAPIS
jgi:hypothetical protein